MKSSLPSVVVKSQQNRFLQINLGRSALSGVGHLSSMYAIYDIETYPNIFTMAVLINENTYCFEISERRDDSESILELIDYLHHGKYSMVGFNNMAFDYPVLHELIRNSKTFDGYAEAQRVIEDDPYNTIIWNPAVPQVDLYKVNHFDNKARTQSLKGIEFALKMDDIQDLPFEPGTDVPPSEFDNLIKYNKHDVKATKLLFDVTKDAIDFRIALSKEYGKNFMNFSDVKCGTEVLILETEKSSPGSCYCPGSRVPRRTERDIINITDVILPVIKFKRSEFQGILDHFKGLRVTETKGSIKNLSTTVDGFKFDYGLGGLHGSVESQAVHSDEDNVIVDVDVASYYPNLAIVNNLYPEHLSSDFCQTYKDIYERRKKHAKGTPENAMLKLALNGAYGNSNNPFSPLYDPQYTMTITVNGQLLLSMLSERLMTINGLKMIQVNTDGVTVRLPRYRLEHLRTVCKWWEDVSGLALEEAIYKSMFIRDVNNYIAVSEDGKVKRKGAYEYAYQLHQDPSRPVVAMAAEAHLVHGKNLRGFIMSHTDPHAFTLRAKMTGQNKCLYGDDIQQKVTRFHMSTNGDFLKKLMPPAGPEGTYKRKNSIEDDYYEAVLAEVGSNWDERIHTKNKSKYEQRVSVIAGGNLVTICNNITDFKWAILDYEWYITEAEKLVEVFQ
jgi:hypothetical protein